MDWYYSHHNQRQGPVSEDQLADLVRQGIVNKSTLVWREGMPDWAPYISAINDPAPAGTHRCGECGKVFPAGDMIEYNRIWICAACKPVFLQRLQEGLNPVANTGWRFGKRLIIDKNAAALPPRCIKCNAPVEGEGIKRQLSWIPSLYYLLVIISVLIFIIVALIVRKRATVTYYLCAEHRAKYRRNGWIAAGMFALSIILFIIAVVQSSVTWVLPAILLLLVALIFALIAGRVIYATRIDNENITLAGCGPEFLAEFPDWTGGS